MRKKLLSGGKEPGEPRSLSSPGVRCSGSTRRVGQLDAGRHDAILDEAPKVDQQLARQRDIDAGGTKEQPAIDADEMGAVSSSGQAPPETPAAADAGADQRMNRGAARQSDFSLGSRTFCETAEEC